MEIPEYIEGIPTEKKRSKERFALIMDNLPLFVSRKEGEQRRNGYKNMILLYYDFRNEEKEYLNFRVKLTIGVMTGGKHIQYCVNKIETKQKSQSCNPLPH